MQNSRPLLFITNDDGYMAGGIKQLIDMLRPLGDLIVVAPDGPRSGSALAITSTTPVSIVRRSLDASMALYSCTGTPVDCVKLGLQELVPRKPDLLVSGINHGDNSGVNVLYSGTMGAVLEGCMKHIPSIGFSSSNYDPSADLTSYTEVVQKICRMVLEQGLPLGSCLNVNFPKENTYNGIRVCRQDEGQWVGEWEKLTRQNGKEHYWLTGRYVTDHPEDDSTDHWALTHGFVSVVPTQIDLTDYALLDEMKKRMNA